MRPTLRSRSVCDAFFVKPRGHHELRRAFPWQLILLMSSLHATTTLDFGPSLLGARSLQPQEEQRVLFSDDGEDQEDAALQHQSQLVPICSGAAAAQTQYIAASPSRERRNMLSCSASLCPICDSIDFVCCFDPRNNVTSCVKMDACPEMYCTCGKDEEGENADAVGPSTAAPQRSCPDEGQVALDISLRTDEFGEETSWSLATAPTTKSTPTLQVGSDYDGKSLYEVPTICLPEKQCYNFTIYDRWGDGMCCQHGDGSYGLALDSRPLTPADGDERAGGGGRFTGTSESTTFGCCPPNALATTFDSRNGQCGNFFDVLAHVDVTIDGFDVHTKLGQSREYVAEVYTKPGTHVGFESDEAEWVQVMGARTIYGRGKNQSTPLGCLDDPVRIAAGEGAAFHVTLTTPDMRYGHPDDDAQGVGSVLSDNGDLAVLRGSGAGCGFPNVTFPSRAWNGVVRYSTTSTPEGGGMDAIRQFGDAHVEHAMAEDDDFYSVGSGATEAEAEGFFGPTAPRSPSDRQEGYDVTGEVPFVPQERLRRREHDPTPHKHTRPTEEATARVEASFGGGDDLSPGEGWPEDEGGAEPFKDGVEEWEDTLRIVP